MAPHAVSFYTVYGVRPFDQRARLSPLADSRKGIRDLEAKISNPIDSGHPPDFEEAVSDASRPVGESEICASLEAAVAAPDGPERTEGTLLVSCDEKPAGRNGRREVLFFPCVLVGPCVEEATPGRTMHEVR